MGDPSDALAFAAHHRERFVAELIDLLRIPSVSTDPACAADVHRCAGWLATHLRSLGLDRAEVIPSDGLPLVFASHGNDPSRPTLLVYGHYDVQPPDPVEAWTSPPFEPVVRGGAVYARGASDDKGQLFLVLKAVEACLRTGGLPVNLRVVLEGEEETGSRSFAPFLVTYRDQIAADAALVCDTAMLAPDRPALVVSLRGIVYVEVAVRAPSHDLHSGVYGGAVANPVTSSRASSRAFRTTRAESPCLGSTMPYVPSRPRSAPRWRRSRSTKTCSSRRRGSPLPVLRPA